MRDPLLQVPIAFKEIRLRRGSLGFVRWWLVDRAVDQWEAYVGIFAKDTVLINVFYFLMGADVSMSAKIDTFVREFDLVRIDKRADVSGAIYARIFEPNGVLRFAPVRLDEECKIKSSAVQTSVDSLTRDSPSSVAIVYISCISL